MPPVSHRKKIAHLKKRDPVLGAVIARTTLRELPARSGPAARGRFEALVEAIVSQQLSVKAADTIFARFAALVPGAAFPTPQKVLAIPSSSMRRAGLSKMKVSFIKDLALRVADGSLDLSGLGRLGDEEVIAELTAVKGIGRWTAEMFLIFSLRRDDVFSYGDLGLRNAMQKIYKMRKAPTPERAARITAMWKPYRSLGSRYLWASLKNQ